MPTQLQGIAQDQTAAFAAHIQLVRLFFRDFAELNLLIRGEESSDRMIAWAILDFLSDFNATPPFTYFTIEDMYARNWQSFATRGTAISLLQSAMLLYARNQLPFSDGGISSVINDKAPMIQSILGLFQSSYEQTKRQIKTAINIEGMLDQGASGLHSEYAVLTTLGYF